MRASLLALSVVMLLSGCGTAAVPGSQGLAVSLAGSPSSAAIAQDASPSAVVPDPTGWDVYRAQYGGGDGEGMIWIDFYGLDFASHSVFVAFTDGGGFGQDPFRYATVDGKRVAGGTADLSNLEAGLSRASVRIGVDERVVQGALTVLENSTAR